MSVSSPFSETLFPMMLSFQIIAVTLPFLLLFSIAVAFAALSANGVVRLGIEVFINLPIVFPPIGTGFLLVYLFGREGLVGRGVGLDLMFTFPGLVLAAFITGIPFISQSILTGIDGDVFRMCEASYTMGKGKLKTFVRIVLPLVRANIVNGALLACARILGEVGISLMVGGNIQGKTNTISLEIYNSVLDGDNTKALKLSFLLILFSAAVFSIMKRMQHLKEA